MAYYGYTIGDAVNPNFPTFANEGFEVYRYIIPSNPTASGNIEVELFTVLFGAQYTGDSGEDLEGLATSPRIQGISAVSEGPGTGNRLNDLNDIPSTAQTFTGAARQFTDTGSDIFVNVQGVATQFILQGSQSMGSILYRTGTSGNYGTTALVQAGVDASEFADGLAIYSRPVNRRILNGAYTGGYIAFASDFSVSDGDGEEIYAVNLNPAAGGDFLVGEIQLVNPDMSDFDVVADAIAAGRPDSDSPADGFDSGLAFTPDGFRLIAQTENGIVYEITDFRDDVLGSTVGDGMAIIRRLGVLTLNGQPIAGSVNGNIEYEGLAVVSEDAQGNPIFTL